MPPPPQFRLTGKRLPRAALAIISGADVVFVTSLSRPILTTNSVRRRLLPNIDDYRMRGALITMAEAPRSMQAAHAPRLAGIYR